MIKTLCAAALCTGLCTAGFAGTITYNYTGTTFDKCGHGGCPANYTSDFDSASLTFSNPLAANLSSADVTSNLLSWTIGDALAYSAFSSSTVGAAQVLLSTNSSGAIVGYQVEAGVQMGNDVAMFNPQVIGNGSGLLFADAVDAVLDSGTGAGFSASSHLTGQWTETLNDYQGGTASDPLFIGGSPITDINGPIGGDESQEFYSFLWGGGTFTATASITDPGVAHYTFSLGGGGNCGNLQTVGLTSPGTISQNLAPGQYCIGIVTDNGVDPVYDIKLGTPIGAAAVPEPATFGLLAVGLAMIGIVSRRSHLGRRA